MAIHSDLRDLDVLDHVVVAKDQQVLNYLVFLADDLVIVALDNGIVDICTNFNLVIVTSDCQIVAGISQPFRLVVRV
jgi:predicted aconitase